MATPREQDDPTRPVLVAWLGYGGLVPFVGLACLGLVAPDDGLRWQSALLAYAAVILSFVGALHWAFAMVLPQMSAGQRHGRYLWSVVPALVAWPCVLLPPGIATPLLIAGFAAQYGQDRIVVRHGGLPAWYLPLRLQLSVVASISLAVAFLSATF